MGEDEWEEENNNWMSNDDWNEDEEDDDYDQDNDFAKDERTLNNQELLNQAEAENYGSDQHIDKNYLFEDDNSMIDGIGMWIVIIAIVVVLGYTGYGYVSQNLLNKVSDVEYDQVPLKEKSADDDDEDDQEERAACSWTA